MKITNTQYEACEVIYLPQGMAARIILVGGNWIRIMQSNTNTRIRITKYVDDEGVESDVAIVSGRRSDVQTTKVLIQDATKVTI